MSIFDVVTRLQKVKVWKVAPAGDARVGRRGGVVSECSLL